MKITKPSVRNTGLQFPGLALFLVTLGVGSAVADVFLNGGSTAVIEQSGGGGASISEVTRYRGGQKIVTRDGSSTDITVQDSGDFPAPGDEWAPARGSADRFDQDSFDKRLTRMDSEERGVDDCSGCKASSTRETFRQQMLQRMRTGFLP